MPPNTPTVMAAVSMCVSWPPGSIEGHHEQGDQAAGERGKGDLHRDPDRGGGGSGGVGEVPSAAWTGRHASGQRGRQ